jgi:hypothetical protein
MTQTIIVTGPPCSGKTTYIENHRQHRDIVIDLDALAHALGYPDPHLDHDTTHPARTYALRARASLLKLTREDRVDVPRVWIISTNGHDQGTTTIDLTATVDVEELHRRAEADSRPPSTHQQIDAWFQRHDEDVSRSW